MPQPIITASVSDIQQQVAMVVPSLERTIALHPHWSSTLALARELQTLASARLDVSRIRNFTDRFRQHLTVYRLKGFDHVIWFAEALERHTA
jgi:hypothetical protein